MLTLWATALTAQTSRMQVTYRVTTECAITRVRATGADSISQDIAETTLRRSGAKLRPPVLVVGSDGAREDEAELAIAKYRADNPDKFFLRTVIVELLDKTSARLTCYFDEDERLTSTVLERADGTKEANIDIEQLPLQKTTLAVETGGRDEFLGPRP